MFGLYQFSSIISHIEATEHFFVTIHIKYNMLTIQLWADILSFNGRRIDRKWGCILNSTLRIERKQIIMAVTKIYTCLVLNSYIRYNLLPQ